MNHLHRIPYGLAPVPLLARPSSPRDRSRSPPVRPKKLALSGGFSSSIANLSGISHGATFDEIHKNNNAIDFSEFMRFGTEFKLVPAVFHRNSFKALFHRANLMPSSDANRGSLSYSEFKECVAAIVQPNLSMNSKP
eukprot:TRINITY_DN28239_c0_g1_i2.p1 TRINITY_DN28239_c0_g1~~TRINITY_DN28239_c0_g1_i2.p1  ORF type:complete len:137 (+),score=21.07 TRINITY_DN28239_c0_g1_i2:181-591(+)